MNRGDKNAGVELDGIHSATVNRVVKPAPEIRAEIRQNRRCFASGTYAE